MMKRRQFVRSTIAAGLMASPLSRALEGEKTLQKTPRDYEGPFYPIGARNRTNDLILADPRDKVLQIHGKVMNVRGDPLSGVLVDIWQADPLGRYNHPKDPDTDDRWEEFLYWGEDFTDAGGSFQFRTYIPGEYGSRPPHIHYKVWQNHKTLLTSQIYFAEFGGTRGKSRSRSQGDLQTVSLKQQGDNVTSQLRVVI